MNNESVIIDDKALAQAFSTLQGALKGDIIMKALRKGAEVFREDARVQLRKTLGAGATSTIKRKKPMQEGITLVEDRAYEEVRVSLYGDFRLKWFEMGTKLRKLKNTGAKDRERGRVSTDRRYLYRKKGKENFYRSGSNRGRITALNFFAEVKSDESKAIDIVNDTLSKELQQLVK